VSLVPTMISAVPVRPGFRLDKVGMLRKRWRDSRTMQV